MAVIQIHAHQIWPIGTFIHLHMSMAVLARQWQVRVIASETLWVTKPKILPVWSFKEKVH